MVAAASYDSDRDVRLQTADSISSGACASSNIPHILYDSSITYIVITILRKDTAW